MDFKFKAETNSNANGRGKLCILSFKKGEIIELKKTLFDTVVRRVYSSTDQSRSKKSQTRVKPAPRKKKHSTSVRFFRPCFRASKGDHNRETDA